MNIEKDLFKTSMDITTFLYYCEKEKVVERDVFNRLNEHLDKYIKQRQLNRKIIRESIE